MNTHKNEHNKGILKLDIFLKIFKCFTTEQLTLTVILSLLTMIPSVALSTANSTFYTYTLTQDNEWKKSQDAYLVSKVLFADLDLYYPKDIFYKNSKLYIADSGNFRIVVYDLATGNIQLIGQDILFTPEGVFVDDNNNIYVADSSAQAVYLFDESGTLIRQYTRPNSILFGVNTNYMPKKVVVDKRGNLYIVSEGTAEGIIQLSREGDFLGFFGSNTVNLSWLQKFQDIFFTSEQRSQLLLRIPKPYNNLAIDTKGLIYTTTRAVSGNAIKKHNTIGTNILTKSAKGRMVDEPNFVDITIANDGRIIAVTETGLIYEYDREGNLLFSLGGRAISSERNGYFTVVSGICVDENDNLYVLDSERGLVHVFVPTLYTNEIHKALILFSDGKYSDSKQKWEDVLKYDGYSKIAHLGLGKAYFQEGDYEQAALHFKIADEREEYSDAYWEIRNKFLEGNATIFLVLFVVIYALFELLPLLRKNRVKKERTNRFKLLKDVMYMFTFLRHPIDGVYYIKRKERTTNLSATIVYGLFFAVAVLNTFGQGYIFSQGASNTTVGYVFLITILPAMLWVVSNNLVSSITDGDGTLSQIYRVTAYALSPFIVIQPIATLLTHFLTLNEIFILQFLTFLVISWCAVNVFIVVKELHNVSVMGTVWNILLTVFWIIIIVFIASLIYMLWSQFYDLIYSIIQEVIYRVRFG
ncbi:MAG: YIP1 family protein [Fervidobacterium sp.]